MKKNFFLRNSFHICLIYLYQNMRKINNTSVYSLLYLPLLYTGLYFLIIVIVAYLLLSVLSFSLVCLWKIPVGRKWVGTVLPCNLVCIHIFEGAWTLDEDFGKTIIIVYNEPNKMIKGVLKSFLYLLEKKINFYLVTECIIGKL